MSEFTPLREAVDTLAGRKPSPDFGELQRRATRRGRRRVTVIAAATAAVIAGSTLAVTSLDDDRLTAPPVEQPKLGPAPNGWVAVDAYQGGGDIYLARLGEDARRLEVAGSDATNEACPVWSPDGKRLLFGRVTGSSDTTFSDAELVIVPIGKNGQAGTPTVIGLEGFEVLDGFDPHPCGTWAPDGRWVALAGTGEVWVVDTQTGAIRHLPDLRPSDLEWRPGTDELVIAGDMGTNRRAPTLATPVTVYSVSTGELRRLGTVEAAQFTWSPDGRTLAYTAFGMPTPPADGDDSLWLADADGTNQRSLVADAGEAVHGIGPVWSPTGDRIAYQRQFEGSAEGSGAEGSVIVLVNVDDGAETVIDPPKTEGPHGPGWWPFTVSWSPDGTKLLYAAWTSDGNGGLPGGVIAVSADAPNDATVLIDAIDPVPDYYSHRWAPTQMWGRRPG